MSTPLSSASTVTVDTLDDFSKDDLEVPAHEGFEFSTADLLEHIRWNDDRARAHQTSSPPSPSISLSEGIDIPRKPKLAQSKPRRNAEIDEFWPPQLKEEKFHHYLAPLTIINKGADLTGLAINKTIHVPAFRCKGVSKFCATPYSLSNLHPDQDGRTSLPPVREDDEPSDHEQQGYLIHEIAEHDDFEMMSAWRRSMYRFSPLPTALSFVVYWTYFAMRIWFTIDASQTNSQSYWIAWCFIAVELIISIPMFLQRVWCLHATGRRRRPKLRLVGNNVPSVDVVITSCKEDEQLILDTALAACNLDYPQERFRVLVCDDGKSRTLENMVRRAAEYGFPNLYYRSRPKFPGIPHHFKAGNLNDAMEVTEKFRGGSGDFFAALDADMIPSRDWLRASIPHMLKDLKCSMTCPPQLFYNVPLNDPLCQSLDGFVHGVEPIKDSLGVAWCTGSGYVIRRDALQHIGGFPVGSLGEDVFCSSMLLGRGWNTAFVHEPLQYGTVPEDLPSHLKQRTRWTIGTIQTSIKMNFCLFGEKAKGMKLYQRICGCIYTVCAVITVFITFSLVLIPFVLISGRVMIPYSSMNQLKWLIRIVFVNLVLNRIGESMTWVPSGYRKGQRDVRMLVWMAPFHAIAVIRTFVLPKWLGGKVAVFTSTGSQDSALHERNAKLRAPLWRRVWVTMIDCQCFMHALYILFVIVSVAVSSYYVFSMHHGVQDKIINFITHAGWPPVMWLTYVVACAEPIRYAIWPPTVPDREELLNRDLKTGVAYPTEESKISENSWVSTAFEVQNSILSLYTTVVFGYSFFI